VWRVQARKLFIKVLRAGVWIKIINDSKFEMASSPLGGDSAASSSSLRVNVILLPGGFTKTSPTQVAHCALLWVY
jgi:hypothetical protein